MSENKIKVTLQILENNYPLMCEPHERNLLIEAAERLNANLRELRGENPKLPLERLLIMNGLQMAFDLLQERQTLAREVTLVNQVSERLLSTFASALGNPSEKT